MYFESNRSSEDGMRAVGTVVMNRLQSSKYPKTICGVVGQERQFADGVLSKPAGGRSFAKALQVADGVIAGDRHDGVGAAMFFHTAGYRFPYRNMSYVVAAGGNVFFVKKQPGTFTPIHPSVFEAKARGDDRIRLASVERDDVAERPSRRRTNILADMAVERERTKTSGERTHTARLDRDTASRIARDDATAVHHRGKKIETASDEPSSRKSAERSKDRRLASLEGEDKVESRSSRRKERRTTEARTDEERLPFRRERSKVADASPARAARTETTGRHEVTDRSESRGRREARDGSESRTKPKSKVAQTADSETEKPRRKFQRASASDE